MPLLVFLGFKGISYRNYKKCCAEIKGIFPFAENTTLLLDGLQKLIEEKAKNDSE